MWYAQGSDDCYRPHNDGRCSLTNSSRWLVLGFALSLALMTTVDAQENEANDSIILPTLDSIDAQTDISVFMVPGVSDELRIPALRRAWSVNPAIRNFRGMAENDWDFTAPHTILGFGDLDPSFDVNQRLAQLFKGTPMDSEQPTITPASTQEANAPSTLGLRDNLEITGWRQRYCLQSADWRIVSALLLCAPS